MFNYLFSKTNVRNFYEPSNSEQKKIGGGGDSIGTFRFCVQNFHYSSIFFATDCFFGILNLRNLWLLMSHTFLSFLNWKCLWQNKKFRKNKKRTIMFLWWGKENSEKELFVWHRENKFRMKILKKKKKTQYITSLHKTLSAATTCGWKKKLKVVEEIEDVKMFQRYSSSKKIGLQRIKKGNILFFDLPHKFVCFLSAEATILFCLVTLCFFKTFRYFEIKKTTQQRKWLSS